MAKEPQVIVLDATPAVADVLSGHGLRPEPYTTGHWGEWAVRTHAVRRLCEVLNLPCEQDRPWLPVQVPDGGYRRWLPWTDPQEGEIVYQDEVRALRVAIGADAGTLFTERVDGSNVHSDGYLIAVNSDGTRCAYTSIEVKVIRSG